MTLRMLVGVLSPAGNLMGPDKRYPNFDCIAVGPCMHVCIMANGHAFLALCFAVHLMFILNKIS
jgi:hypothetical protein